MSSVLSDVVSHEDFDRALIADLRDRFLAEPNTDLSDVRPLVARSWFRSKAAGVRAEQDNAFYLEGRVDVPTLLAAEPHLRQLDGVLEDMGGFVSLTAPNGALIRPDFLRQVDAYDEGYCLLEESCGSNGEGLAIEEGRAVWLAPEEHFREDMRGNWCFASLVRDPINNRVRAVIGLTLPAHRVTGLEPSSTLLMLEGVTARIERAIEDRMASKERALLSEYLSVSRRRGNTAVIAMDGKNTLMNSLASQTFRDDDYSVLEGYARDAIRSGESNNIPAVLSGDRMMTLEVSPVRLTPSKFAAVVVVRPETSSRQEAHRTSQSQRLGSIRTGHSPHVNLLKSMLHGISPEFQSTLGVAAEVIASRRSCLLLGEQGSGKSRLASAISSCLEVKSLTLRLSDGKFEPSLEELASDEYEECRVLILEDAENLSARQAQALIELFDRANQPQFIIAATRVSGGVSHLAERLDLAEISITPLRNRREDIAPLAHAIAAEAGSKQLSSAFLKTLVNADWPRNTEQLRALVLSSIERSRGDEITTDDLPGGFHRVISSGRLTRLEDAELSEIRGALQEAKGNRRQAAEILQIGRSTLYRRMDYFRSRGFEL